MFVNRSLRPWSDDFHYSRPLVFRAVGDWGGLAVVKIMALPTQGRQRRSIPAISWASLARIRSISRSSAGSPFATSFSWWMPDIRHCESAGFSRSSAWPSGTAYRGPAKGVPPCQSLLGQEFRGAVRPLTLASRRTRSPAEAGSSIMTLACQHRLKPVVCFVH